MSYVMNQTNILEMIDDIDLEIVNEETSPFPLKMCVTISGLIIFAVNICIIREIMRERDFTFINILVLFDCVDSLLHIPIYAQYF